MKSVWTNRIAVAALMAVVALPAQGQGKSQGKEKGKKPEKVVVVTSKGEVDRKRVTTSRAVVVSREVLVANGYTVVNVVPTGTTQVIYFRRGNRGNGRGIGPVEKIIVVPSGDVVRFTTGPEPILATILRRLGL